MQAIYDLVRTIHLLGQRYIILSRWKDKWMIRNKISEAERLMLDERASLLSRLKELEAMEKVLIAVKRRLILKR